MDSQTPFPKNKLLDEDRDPIEVLAAEYMERRRRGEAVCIQEYVEREPELAEEIQDLFPAIDAMEKLGGSLSESRWNPQRNLETPQKIGDFRLIREIARGGMGIIYSAVQESLEREVAIKILVGPTMPREQDLKRFHREAHTAAGLHHTNIVPVFGAGEQDGIHYIVMQLIPGVGLDEIFSELRTLTNGSVISDPSLSQRQVFARRVAMSLWGLEWNQGLEPSEAGYKGANESAKDQRFEPKSCDWQHYFRSIARIGCQSASALSYAHRQHILHRDVKPGNVLVDAHGNSWLADFGLARAVDADGITIAGDMVGTLGYMAPERFSGEVGESADVFALGVTLYEMLTLFKAYEGSDRISVMYQIAKRDLVRPKKQNKLIPSDLDTIVSKAISREISDRYQSSQELADDLERFLNGEPIRAKRFSRLETGWRWCRKNRALAGLAASFVVLLGATLFITVQAYVRETALRHRAESTSALALNALDEIYSSFSPSPLDFASEAIEHDEDWQNLETRGQPTLSKEVSLVLENLLRFYDDLSKHSDKTDGIAQKSIAASRRVGDIQRRLGEFEKSNSSYSSAIRRINQLSSTLHDSAEVRLELARACNGLGSLLQQNGRVHEAASLHHSAINALRLYANPSPVFRLELANSLLLEHRATVGQMGRRRRMQSAQESPMFLQEAIEIMDGLLKENPDEPEYQLMLARCLNSAPTNLGAMQSDASSTQPFACEDRAIEILEKLVRNWPEVADYQYELVDTYVNVDLRRILNPPSDPSKKERAIQISEKRLNQGIESAVELESRYPQIPEYKSLAMRLHFHMALLQKEKGNLAGACPHFEKSIDRQVVLLRGVESRRAIRSILWLSHLRTEYAQVLISRDHFSQARDQLNVAIEAIKSASRPQANQTGQDFGRRFLANAKSRIEGILETIPEPVESAP